MNLLIGVNEPGFQSRVRSIYYLWSGTLTVSEWCRSLANLGAGVLISDDPSERTGSLVQAGTRFAETPAPLANGQCTRPFFSAPLVRIKKKGLAMQD